MPWKKRTRGTAKQIGKPFLAGSARVLPKIVFGTTPLATVEKKILLRHKNVPTTEIYHLVENKQILDAIMKEGMLKPRADGLLSFTANKELTAIFPEEKPRKYRLVFDFKKIKHRLAPVFYFTDDEFYEKNPPKDVISYYRKKYMTGDLTNWNGSLVYISTGEPMQIEDEWKSAVPISLNRLIRVEDVQ
jgi:hypothetical protein